VTFAAFQPFQALTPFRSRVGGLSRLAALIKSLFGASEQGGMWLPEPCFCWKDTAGTIPCTAPGDLVARNDDVSGNGNHATQATLASRPALGRTVEGGRRNLMINSDQAYNNTLGWAVTGGTLTQNFTTVDGRSVTRGQRVAAGGSLSAGGVYALPLSGATAGRTFTASFYVKNNGGATGLKMQITEEGGATANVPYASPTFTLSDDGQRISFTHTIVQNDRTTLLVFFGLSDAAGTYDILVWDHQIEEVATATPYQRIGASALDVTEAGKKELWYLQFDGVDDFLRTGNIDMSGTPDVTTAYACRFTNDATGRYMLWAGATSNFEEGMYSARVTTTNIASKNQRITRFNEVNYERNNAPTSPDDFASQPAEIDAVGMGRSAARAGIFTANMSTEIFWGAGLSHYHMNSPTTNAAVHGNLPLTIGARYSTEFFNNRLYGACVVGKHLGPAEEVGSNLSPRSAEYEQLRDLLASRSGVTLP
jgi:hypothetical protein